MTYLSPHSPYFDFHNVRCAMCVLFSTFDKKIDFRASFAMSAQVGRKTKSTRILLNIVNKLNHPNDRTMCKPILSKYANFLYFSFSLFQLNLWNRWTINYIENPKNEIPLCGDKTGVICYTKPNRIGRATAPTTSYIEPPVTNTTTTNKQKRKIWLKILNHYVWYKNRTHIERNAR